MATLIDKENAVSDYWNEKKTKNKILTMQYAMRGGIFGLLMVYVNYEESERDWVVWGLSKFPSKYLDFILIKCSYIPEYAWNGEMSNIIGMETLL